MSLRTLIMERLRDRRAGTGSEKLSGKSPEARHASITKKIESSILPRRISLLGQGIDIRITAADGRLVGAEVKVPGDAPRTFDFARGVVDRRHARDFDSLLRVICEDDHALTFAAEPIGELPDPKAGVELSVLFDIADKVAAEQAKAEARAPAPAKPKKPAPVTEPAAEKPAAAAPRPVAPANPDRPFAFLDSCRSMAMEARYFSAKGRGAYAHRKDNDRYYPREEMVALDAWRSRVSPALGEDVTLVMIPEDKNADMIAVAVNENHGVEFDFARRNLGRICGLALGGDESAP